MNPPPEVAVVILNWNGFSDTSECLDSLRRITYPSFKAIVIDNGSSGDEASALRERFPEARVIASPKNLGFAGGCNLAIRQAADDEPEYVLLLNNDVTVDPRFLDGLVGGGAKVTDAG